jgi:hypothetical protein
MRLLNEVDYLISLKFYQDIDGHIKDVANEANALSVAAEVCK